jgi:hypothetical protein
MARSPRFVLGHLYEAARFQFVAAVSIALCAQPSRLPTPMPDANTITLAPSGTGTIALDAGFGQLIVSNRITISGPGVARAGGKRRRRASRS